MKASNYCKVPVSYYYVGPRPLDSHQSLSIDLSPAGRDPAGEEREGGGGGRGWGTEEEYIIINLRSDPRGYPRVSTRDSPSKSARGSARQRCGERSLGLVAVLLTAVSRS